MQNLFTIIELAVMDDKRNHCLFRYKHKAFSNASVGLMWCIASALAYMGSIVVFGVSAIAHAHYLVQLYLQ